MKSHRVRHHRTYHSDQAISDAIREFDRLSSSNGHPKRDHQIAQQRYTIFDNSCLDCGATFINYALLRMHAARCNGIPTDEMIGNKVRCEECGAYMLSTHMNRHLEA